MLVSPDCSPYEKKETTEGETKEDFAVSSPPLPYSKTVGFGTYTPTFGGKPPTFGGKPPTFGGKRKKKTKIKRRGKNKYRRKTRRNKKK